MHSGLMFENQQLFAKALLEQAEHGHMDCSVQGLGMMRIYLSEGVRLHVWHHDLEVFGVTKIHEHPWDFESLVICGELENYRYLKSDEKVKDTECYVQDMLLCGTGNLAHREHLCWLGSYHPSGKPNTYVPGGTYSQRYDEIHRTDFVDGTVTLIRRNFVNDDRDHAYVYWPDNRRFVSAEPRSATPQEILRVTGAALKLLSK